MPGIRSSLIVTTIALAEGGSTIGAWGAELELTGVRWEKPSSAVTYWVNVKGKIAPEALADVQTAIDDWNAALAEIPEVPTLEMATSQKRADIVLTLRSRERRFLGGGSGRFGGWATYTQLTGCALESVAIDVVGLTTDIEDFRIRNLVRRLLGEALGLGYLSACTTGGCIDIMGDVNINGFWPGGDLLISECHILGVEAIYTASNCEQIPVSVPYNCE